MGPISRGAGLVSATCRTRQDGTRTVRNADDNYATPAWCVREILPYVLPDRPCTVLDPCCGSGAILDAVTSDAPWSSTMGIEIDLNRFQQVRSKYERKDLSFQIMHSDALNESCVWPSADLILTNPPYRLALEFLRRALDEDGTVAFLLRLNFLGSQARREFWRDNAFDVYVLSRRPSFTGNGTDATEYAWFVRREGQKERRWHVL